MNGHSYVAGELRRAGVAFRMEDNAIVRCADPALLTSIADRLDERILQQRANYWASRLAPRFSARERVACQLHYQWSVAQIEFTRDVIFQRRARLRDLFQRAVEIGVALGGATQTRHIFGRHINRRYRGKLETVLERRDEGFPVLRSYYKLLRQAIREGQSAVAYRDLPERHLPPQYRPQARQPAGPQAAFGRHHRPLPRTAGGTARLHHRHRCPGQAGGAGVAWLTPCTRHQTAR